MKKLFLSIVAAIVAATATYAQSTLVATLSHDGVTTAYYGADALINANNASQDGDVITLSSGTFKATTITKCITLRGVGMFENTIAQVLPTSITGEMYFTIPEGSVGRLIVEGLCFLNNVIFGGKIVEPIFTKTRFLSSIKGNGNSYKVINPTYIQCFVKGYVLSDSNNTFINCVLGEISSNENYIHTYENCVVITSSDLSYQKSPAFTNCILVSTASSTGYLRSSCSAYNCIALYKGTLSHGTGGDISIFTNIGNKTNKEMHGSGSLIFKTYEETFNDGETFELTDEAASTYLGMDGTQVGIYGGDLPFDSTPSNPQITQFDVEKNVANGKLTVKINVEQ